MSHPFKKKIGFRVESSAHVTFCPSVDSAMTNWQVAFTLKFSISFFDPRCLFQPVQRHCYVMNTSQDNHLFQFLLGAELVGVTAFLLSAVGGTRRKTSVAFAADKFVTVVFRSKNFQ